MNKFMIFTAALMMTVAAHAKTIAPTEQAIRPSSIDQSITLAKSDSNGSYKKVTLVVADRGLSTDMSPRYSIYLGYSSNAEMGNLWANYSIGSAFSDVTAKRVSAGIYEVKYQDFRDGKGMIDVTLTIDTTEVFIADRKQRDQCGDDFCDGVINANITVKETSVPAK